jgi:hypothetical protein
MSGMDNISNSQPGGLQPSQAAGAPEDRKISKPGLKSPKELSLEVQDRVDITPGRKKEKAPLSPRMASFPASPPKEKEVTVLFYMNGKYPDLEEGLASSMLNLEGLGSSGKMNLVTQLARAPQEQARPMGGFDRIDSDWDGVRRYYVVKNEGQGGPEVTLEEWKKITEKLPRNPMAHFQYFEELKRAGRTAEADREYKLAEQLGFAKVMGEGHDPQVARWSAELDAITQGIRDKAAPFQNYKSPVVEELKKTTDMGSPYTLKDFVSWGMKSYPAQHYVVVLMGHGGAWTGALEMSPVDIGQAVQAGVQEANKATKRNDEVDALVFNSCYMGNLETVEQMKNAARTTIASEMSALSSVFAHWPQLLEKTGERLDRGEEFNPVTFARDFVGFYRRRGEEIKDEPKLIKQVHQSYLTLVALDNTKVENVAKAWDNFIQAWKESGIPDRDVFKKIASAKNYPSSAYTPEMLFDYGTLRDLGDIAGKVIADPKMPDKMREAAVGIVESLKAAVIDEQHTGLDMEGSTGLSVWAPTHASDIALMADAYNERVPSFTQKTAWLEKMGDALKNVPEESLVKFIAVIQAIGQLMQIAETPGIDPKERMKIELKLQSLKMEARKLKGELDLSKDPAPPVVAPRFKLYAPSAEGKSKEDDLDLVFQRMQKEAGVSKRGSRGKSSEVDDYAMRLMKGESFVGGGEIISRNPRETVVKSIMKEAQLNDGMAGPHRSIDIG